MATPFQMSWSLLKGTEDWHHNAAHSLNLMIGGYDNEGEGEMGYKMLDTLHSTALRARGVSEDKIHQQLNNQHFFAKDRDWDLWHRVMQPLSHHINSMYNNMVGDPEKVLPMMQEWDKNAVEHRGEQEEKLRSQEQFKQFMQNEAPSNPIDQNPESGDEDIYWDKKGY